LIFQDSDEHRSSGADDREPDLEAITTPHDVSETEARARGGVWVVCSKCREFRSQRSPLRPLPHVFSGGMRQRAMIAMAFANDRPEVLIARRADVGPRDVTIQAQIVVVSMRAAQEGDANGFEQSSSRTSSGLIAEARGTGWLSSVRGAAASFEHRRRASTIFDFARPPLPRYGPHEAASRRPRHATGVRLVAIPGQPPEPRSTAPARVRVPPTAARTTGPRDLGGCVAPRPCRSCAPPARASHTVRRVYIRRGARGRRGRRRRRPRRRAY
jgi:hypothetical protein